MEMISVESSNVAAVLYLADERVLLVKYRDGSLYARTMWTPTDYERLMAAQSKGQFLARCIDPTILISKGGANIAQEQAGQSSGPVNTSGEATGPLNVIDENASKCCRKALEVAFSWAQFQHVAVPHFDCPQCGTHFRHSMEGPVRHWRIHEHFAVHRR